MDALLEDMLRRARDLLRKHFGDLPEAGINWDGPVTKFRVPNGLEQSRVSHAIGFIAGCAAMADVTPLTLLDEIRDMTPDVERELTVETAKHEGTVIDAGHVAVHLVPIPRMTPVRDLYRVQGVNRQPKRDTGKRQRIRRIK